jgi:hypothetical protein
MSLRDQFNIQDKHDIALCFRYLDEHESRNKKGLPKLKYIQDAKTLIPIYTLERKTFRECGEVLGKSLALAQQTLERAHEIIRSGLKEDGVGKWERL